MVTIQDETRYRAHVFDTEKQAVEYANHEESWMSVRNGKKHSEDSDSDTINVWTAFTSLCYT